MALNNQSAWHQLDTVSETLGSSKVLAPAEELSDLENLQVQNHAAKCGFGDQNLSTSHF